MALLRISKYCFGRSQTRHSGRGGSEQQQVSLTLGLRWASSSSALAAFFLGCAGAVAAFSAFLASLSRCFWRFLTVRDSEMRRASWP